jgi:ATP-dependent RNA helicase RhlE
MPNRQANNNVAAVRVNLLLRSNLLCRAMPGIRLMNKRKTA